MDRIVVTGNRFSRPADSRQLGPGQVDRLQPHVSDSARLLEGLPGIAAQGAGGVSALPVIRGLAGDRNRIQIDGMDLVASCPNHMNPPLSYLDPAKVGKVTVFAGVVPVSAGGDSIGGAIVAESHAPRFADAGEGWTGAGEIGAHMRSNGNLRGMQLSASLASDAFHLGYEGSVEQADNYRAADDFRGYTATGREGHELPRDEVGSSAWLVRNHALALAWQRDAHLVELRYGNQSMPYQLYPNQRMDLTGNSQHRLQLRYEGMLGWGTLEARAWQERLQHGMDFGPDKQFWYGAKTMLPGIADYSVPCSPIAYDCAAGMPMRTASRTSAASLKATIGLRETDLLRLGLDLQQYRLDDWWPPSGSGMFPGTFWNIRDGQRDRASAFVEWQGSVGERWSGLFGARLSHVTTDAGPVHGYDTDPAPPGSAMMTLADAAAFNAAERRRSDTHLDLVVSLQTRVSDGFDLEFGLSRKTRSPNLYERYAWSTWAMAAVMNNTAGDGNGYVGDIALQPETAHTLSATFDWHAVDGRWRLKLMPHASWIDDAIDAVRISDNGAGMYEVLRYANQSARIHGLDASFDATLHESDDARYVLGVSASWLHGENRDTGEPLYHQMPPNARIRIGQQSGGWDNTLEWELVARKDRVSAVRREPETAGYGLLHLRLRHAWTRWQLDAGIENLLDKAYAPPLGGTYLGQGRTMGINSVPHGIAVPGPGRSLYLGARFAF